MTGHTPARGRRAARLGATLAATLAATTAAALLSAPGAASAFEPGCETMPYVAHRGVLVDGTSENTLGSMLKAARRGAGAEIDLRTNAENRVVLMHDRGLARTTNGRGLVSSKTNAQIRRLRTDDGQRVPFLKDALLFVRDRPRMSVVLDLKAFTPVSMARMAALITELGVSSQISMISFHDPLIADFRAATEGDGIDTFKIAEGLPSPEQAATYGGVNVWGHLLTDEWIAQMQQTQVPFNLRVTESEALWDAAVRLGSTWVMTDDVDAWRRYCPAG